MTKQLTRGMWLSAALIDVPDTDDAPIYQELLLKHFPRTRLAVVEPVVRRRQS